LSRDEGESSGFQIIEKLFALLIILIGALLAYNTSISPDLTYSIFFGVGGLALIILGVFIVTAKIK
jgi:hypothetical protein